MDFELWAFVVMPDHCHVLLKPRQEVYSIADILRAIKSPAAKAILAQYSHFLDGLEVSRPSRGNRNPDMAARGRLRPEHLRRQNRGTKHQLYPHESGSKRLMRNARRMAVVELSGVCRRRAADSC